ncbi:MAG: ATP synthase subunit I [Pseudomonadota bacterium]
MINGQDERKLVTRLNSTGWVILAVLTTVSVSFFPLEASLGVAMGGLLVTVNLSLLHRLVFKASEPGSRITPGMVLPKYYLRFAATLALLFILISQNLVHPLGLLLGLSVFFLDVMGVVLLLSLKLVYQTITKEAV